MPRLLAISLLVLLFSCDSKRTTNRNPFLQEVNFRFDINTNLPSYNSLTNEGGAIYVDNLQAGTSGVFVIKTISAFSGYRVFEASCPNHSPNDCSTMTLKGNVVSCPCEDYEYTLFTGQLLNRPDDENRYYDLLEYRAVGSGNTIILSN